MNDHLSKPIDPALLFETVARFAARTKGAASDRAVAPMAPMASEPPRPSPARVGLELPAVEGLDTAEGLGRVAGNRGLYLKLLRQFVEQQTGVLERIEAARRGGDLVLAERLAHTLKGVAASLGVRRLPEAAAQLEKAFRDRATATAMDAAGRQVAAELEPVLARLSEALARLEGVPPSEAAAPAAATNSAEGRARAKEAGASLAKLLAEFDPGAADFVEAHRAALRGLFDEEAWGRLEGAIRGYDFAGAQAQLEAVL